ncbi:hypothetical protein [Variovorax sp. EBFNA2]|uniref:hypothetical protein n=1 Tax=Variovorax sp. EBFNA2 TaxID=3342097 RepID=UPI0029C0962A|nr:hypothetical protein [Variovorax boronicumulans]WPG35157.1 hypothetical protein RZE79_16830 [Variovorax boronicumulans]
MDGTDEFDGRLTTLYKKARASETAAATDTYERLRTAKAIARSLLDKPSNADVLAVLASLTAAGIAGDNLSASTKTVEGDSA